MSWAQALPVVFFGLMGLSMFVYVVLDGFDLGVGMLLPRAGAAQKDMMIASIGPFWDANETWLVLGIGLLLIAFPKAHGVVMTALYLPIALMLVGLTLRGVAFDFRVKAKDAHKALWNRAFFAGSMLASLAQGWMLGRYITGFAQGEHFTLFAAAIALCLPAAYTLIGACWLVMKTDGGLQANAVRWARQAWLPVALGLALISLATPWVSHTVFERWFAFPQLIALSAIPLMSVICLVATLVVLRSNQVIGALCWLPFAFVVTVFTLGGIGLAYSLYPYVVIDRMTIWQAASATESLAVILIGCAITVPAIVLYTLYAYRVFWGKARALDYA
jgi:cytochrome d ubiquinol oxidase subunit II